MSKFTSEWLADREARNRASTGQTAPPDAVERESDLHGQIMDDIRRRGWLAVHSRMDMASTTACGVPDFGIVADGGQTYWIECKARGGKLTEEQQAFGAAAQKLGHRYAVVWNFAQYLDRINEWRKETK